MKKPAIIFLPLLFVINSFAQDIPRNNVFFEAGGAAFFYSFNYERLFLKNIDHNFSARTGVMYLPLFGDRHR